MNVVSKIISALFICNGTISTLVSFIMLCFLLRKKKKNAIYVMVVALVATNCIHSISLCFAGIFNFVPLNRHVANFTTPQICLLSRSHYLIITASARQAPMFTFCIAVIQLRNACSVKCNTTNVTLKTIILTCGIFLLNICLCGASVFQIICCSFGERIISALCFYYDVLPPVMILSNFYIVLLLSILSFLLDISTVLIIRSKFSSSHAIREIQSIRQKAIIQKLKIISIAQLLYSCVLAICTFATNLSFSTYMVVICILSVYPYFSAGNTVIYANLVISVIDRLKEIHYNLKKWCNRLYNSLFHCVSEVSVSPTS
ncbi:hypothetical protein T11_7534 [Trichinella zimbabwensis]|uniref:G-protein coupled receptors family 1 profile domain-containing protein n=1 Tax=Trichinella zimbabwensis TaxID=268475 RepID=A0A0V1GW88_9BILA|nr:hypothetical protein T11_7534 [Trichinella zimbabwensis]